MFRMSGFAEIHFSQKDGGPPQTVAAAPPPGAGGVSIGHVRFDRAARISAASIDLLLIAVDPCWLALAAAEDAAVDARLGICMSRRDRKLSAIAHLLAA